MGDAYNSANNDMPITIAQRYGIAISQFLQHRGPSPSRPTERSLAVRAHVMQLRWVGSDEGQGGALTGTAEDNESEATFWQQLALQ